MAQVVVVGAGPTGLTLACLLRANGVDVTVVDCLEAPARLAKAMVLWSRSLEILDEIGVAGPARDSGVPLRRARYLDGDRVVAAIRTDAVPDTRWQPVILPQDILEGLLRARFERLGGTIEWGRTVTGVRLTSDRSGRDDSGPGGVQLDCAGAGGDTTVMDAAFVAGCDGLRSAVREGAGIEWSSGTPYEEVFQLGDVDADTTLDRTQVHHFLGRHGVSVAIPMPGERWRVVGYLDGDEGPDRPCASDLERLLTECGHRATSIGAVHWSGRFRVTRRLAETFRAGPVFLAGDAAHVHSPAGGQGLNTGIQDAHNLAWKLAFVVKGQAGEQLLDTYTAERRPIAKTILRVTELQDSRLFGARSRVSRGLRNTVLGALAGAGVLERRLIPDLAQMLVSYRRSSLSVGKAPAGSVFRPGRRVADVEQLLLGHDAATRVLPACAAPAITVLAVPGRRPVGDLAAVRAVTDRFSSVVRLHVLAEPLPDVPAPRRGGYLLGVRPDGHVGYRGPLAATPAFRAWLDDGVALVPDVRTDDRNLVRVE